jgi:putative oxidoreductase
MTSSLSFHSDDTGKLLLRLVLGIVLLFHGVFKLQHGVAWISGMLAAHGLPGVLAYGAYIGEIVAPLCVIPGYRTRLAALLMAFDMVVAISLTLRPTSIRREGNGRWMGDRAGSTSSLRLTCAGIHGRRQICCEERSESVELNKRQRPVKSTCRIHHVFMS